MGWMELLVVGVVALIVVGPKDLPVMFQALGKMTAKVKRMAREFQTAMSEAADATGAADISRDLRGLTSAKSLGIDKLKEAAESFDKWEPTKDKPAVGPATAKLSKKRAEDARKIRDKAAEVAQARLDREAATSAKPKPGPKTKPKAAARTKPAAKAAVSAKPKPAAKVKPAKKAKPAAKVKPTAATKPAKPRRAAKPASDSKA